MKYGVLTEQEKKHDNIRNGILIFTITALPALIKTAVNRIHVALIPQYNPEAASALFPAASYFSVM